MAEGAGSISTGGSGSQPLDIPVETGLEVPADWVLAPGGAGQCACSSYSPVPNSSPAQSGNAWPPPVSQWQGDPRDIFGTPPPSPSDPVTNPLISSSISSPTSLASDRSLNTGGLDAWLYGDDGMRFYDACTQRTAALTDAVLVYPNGSQSVLTPNRLNVLFMINVGDEVELRAGGRSFRVLLQEDGYHVIDPATCIDYGSGTDSGPFRISAQGRSGALIAYRGPGFVPPIVATPVSGSGPESVPDPAVPMQASSSEPALADGDKTGAVERPPELPPEPPAAEPVRSVELGPVDITDEVMILGNESDFPYGTCANDGRWLETDIEVVRWGRGWAQLAPTYDPLSAGDVEVVGNSADYAMGEVANDPGYTMRLSEGDIEILCDADALPRGYAVGEEGYDLNRGLHPEIYEQPARAGRQSASYVDGSGVSETGIPADVVDASVRTPGEVVVNNSGPGALPLLAVDECVMEGPTNTGTFEEAVFPESPTSARVGFWQRILNARLTVAPAARSVIAFVTQTLAFLGLHSAEGPLAEVPVVAQMLSGLNIAVAHVPTYMIATGADFVTAATSRESLMAMFEGGGRFFAVMPLVTRAMDRLGLTADRLGSFGYGAGAVVGAIGGDRALVATGQAVVGMLTRRAAAAAAEGSAEAAAAYTAAAQTARWTFTRGIPVLGTAILAWDIGTSIPAFVDWSVVGLAEAFGIADAQSFQWDIDLLDRFCAAHRSHYARCNSRSELERMLTPTMAPIELAKIESYFNNGADELNRIRREMASEVREDLGKYRTAITALFYEKAMMDITDKLQRISLSPDAALLEETVAAEVAQAFTPPALPDGTSCNGMDDDCDNSDGIDWGEQAEIDSYDNFKESLRAGISLSALRGEYGEEVFDDNFSRYMGEMLAVVSDTETPFEGWSFGDEFEQRVSSNDSGAVASLMMGDMRGPFEQQKRARLQQLMRSAHYQDGELIVDTSSMSGQDVTLARSFGLIYENDDGHYAIADSPTYHVYEAIMISAVAEMPDEQRQALLAQLS